MTQLQKERIKIGRKILAIFLVMALLAGLFVPNFVASQFGIRYWIALPLTIIATLVGLPALGFTVLVLRLVARFRRLSDERFVLATARKAAGEEGQVVKTDSATCWYTGPESPVEMVMAQMDATRSRLESLLGSELVCQPPPRILCFGRRPDFEEFFKPLFAHLMQGIRTVDGMYIRPPCRTVTICTDQLPYRVVDHEQTACSLFCTYFMDAFPGGCRGLAAARHREDPDERR